jgi:hypothetical protein
VEERVDGYVVDLVRDDLLVEIQTGGFAPLRVHCPGRAWRRRGWVRSCASSSDTAELASAARYDRRTAQQVAYCLRACGAIERSGTRGRAAVYRTCVRNRLGPVQADL